MKLLGSIFVEKTRFLFSYLDLISSLCLLVKSDIHLMSLFSEVKTLISNNSKDIYSKISCFVKGCAVNENILCLMTFFSSRQSCFIATAAGV